MILNAVMMTVAAHGVGAPGTDISYEYVHAIFAKHCVSCHAGAEPEAELVLESYESWMKGGEDGAVLVAGKAEQSLLVQQIEHKKKPFMPPPKKGEKLSEAQIALIRAWIDGGARGPQPLVASTQPSSKTATLTALPKIAPKSPPRRAVYALAYSDAQKILSV